MARISSQFSVFVCATIQPELRRVLSLYLIEVAPLTFVGRLSTRVRNKLWTEINSEFGEHKITLSYPTTQNEQGFLVLQSKNAVRYTHEAEGLILGMRRLGSVEDWEKLPAKSPQTLNDGEDYYPLIMHLLDTAAVAGVLWDSFLSGQQKRIMVEAFEGNDKNVAVQLARTLAMFLAGSHDLGKGHPAWLENTLKLNKRKVQTELNLSQVSIDDMSDKVYENKDLKNHGFVSGLTVLQHLLNLNKNADENDLISFVQPLIAHHGHFTYGVGSINEARKNAVAGSSSYIWSGLRNQVLSNTLKTLNIQDFPEKLVQDGARLDDFGILLYTGFVSLCDWIASRKEFISSVRSSSRLVDQSTDEYYKSHYDTAVTEAQLFVAENAMAIAQWSDDISFEKMYSFEPNQLQKTLIQQFGKLDSNSSPGLLFISAPMGYGKTEAASYVAAQMGRQSEASGLWFTLPTRATTDLMFERSKDLGKKIFQADTYSVALSHSSAVFSNQLDGINIKGTSGNKWLSNVENPKLLNPDVHESEAVISGFLLDKRLGGNSSISLSTIDQLLGVSIPLKFNTVSWLSVSGKVLIIDEVHDFDSYTFALILKLVKWCGRYKIPVIVMSATLKDDSQERLLEAYRPYKKANSPTDMEREVVRPIPSPAWVHIPSDVNSPREESILIDTNTYPDYEVFMHEDVNNDFASNVENIISSVSAQKPVIFVICNTVNESIKIYDQISNSKQENEIFLLHSRMSTRRKKLVVDKLTSITGKPTNAGVKRKPIIVVATQIIEQSMDIDGDILITQAAPLPAILQRVGRIARHEQPDRAVKQTQIHIVLGIKNELESNRNPYLPYTEWEINSSWQVLLEGQKENQPYTVRNLKKEITSLLKRHAELMGSVLELLPPLESNSINLIGSVKTEPYVSIKDTDFAASYLTSILKKDLSKNDKKQNDAFKAAIPSPLSGKNQGTNVIGRADSQFTHEKTSISYETADIRDGMDSETILPVTQKQDGLYINVTATYTGDRLDDLVKSIFLLKMDASKKLVAEAQAAYRKVQNAQVTVSRFFFNKITTTQISSVYEEAPLYVKVVLPNITDNDNTCYDEVKGLYII